MLRLPLHVQQRTSLIHDHDQMDQSDLRSVTGEVKHRLARKQAADCHAIEPTDQVPIGIPDLDGVGPTQSVQLRVGVDELIGDPPVGTIDLGAIPNDRSEIFIDRDLIAAG